MTSICNYSHPELQISQGLERDGAGVLFPYNPEFYELASGLYGPGSILTWHFLIASVVLRWICGMKGGPGHTGTRPGMSTDLLAVLAYPAFAATDLLIQALGMIGTEHRALAIFCLRYPGAKLDGRDGEFSHVPLNLAEIPPDVVSLGQRAVQITGPLAVCYVFVDVCFVLAMSVVVAASVGARSWRPTVAARRSVLAGYAYVALALVIFHLSLGNLSTGIRLFMIEASQPLLLAFMLCAWIGCGGAVLILSVCCVVALIHREWGMARDFARWLGWSVLVSIALGTLTALVVTVTGRALPVIIPDLAVTIDERDQLAALLAGLAALVYTVYTVIRDRVPTKRGMKTDMEEMQGLTVAGEDAVELGVRDSAQRRTLEHGETTTHDERIASYNRSITF
ncbi:hypothetical protein B0I37DRAFT_195564 [Chaetomium sp. MPI-CAGE-AT-0009]|nr:hypothetical protein B0I37DRAFT_195564 [Chaetomium sp. MPI-CAGE-AT-0009]